MYVFGEFNHELYRSINSDEITHHTDLQKERISGELLDIYGAPWFYRVVLCYSLLSSFPPLYNSNYLRSRHIRWAEPNGWCARLAMIKDLVGL